MAYKSKKKNFAKYHPRKRTMKNRRKRYTRRRNKRGASSVIIRGVGLPDRMFMKLNLVMRTKPIMQADLLHQVMLIRTSLYDPDTFAGGNQPMWYDQMSPLYLKYRVFGFKYKLFTFASNNNATVFTAVKPQRTEQSEFSDLSIMEREDVKYKIGQSISGGKSFNTYKGYVGVAKTLGVSKTAVKVENDFQGMWNNHPNRMAYLGVYGQSNATGQWIEFIMKLTFYVEFSERNLIGRS